MFRILLQSVNFNGLCFRIHRPKLRHSRRGVSFALQVFVQMRGPLGKDFDDESRSAFRTGIREDGSPIIRDEHDVRLENIVLREIDIKGRGVKFANGVSFQVLQQNEFKVSRNVLW